jgi:hypothetical protein
VLSRSNTVHTFTQSILILSSHQRLRPFYFSNSLCELIYSTCTKFPAHLITGLTLQKEYKHYYFFFYYYYVGRDSAFGIAVRYGPDGPGIKSWLRRNFLCPSHPVSCTMGTRSFPGVKRLGRGADHLPHLAPTLKEE